MLIRNTQSKYNKDALVRRDAALGLQRSNLLKEILRYKEQITRLEMSHSGGGGGGGGSSSAGNNSGGGAVSGSAGAAPMSNEERRATIRLQKEITDLRKETERMIHQVTDLTDTNDELLQQIASIADEKDQEMSLISSELLDSQMRIEELEFQLSVVEDDLRRTLSKLEMASAEADDKEDTSPTVALLSAHEVVCQKCKCIIPEPLCPSCIKPLAPSPPKTLTNPTAPVGDHASSSALPAGKTSIFARIATSAAKAKISARLVTPKTVSLQVAQSADTAATPSPAAARGPKKRQWSFEKDIVAWKEHCDMLIAQEKEASRLKLDEKEAELAELLHAALQGRIEIYEQLAQVERNYWEPLLLDANRRSFQLLVAHKQLCADTREDLEDLVFCISVRKVPWMNEKENMPKIQEEFTQFIHKQVAVIKSLRKEIRALNKSAPEMRAKVEAEKTVVAEERKRHEKELLDARSRLFESDVFVQKLKFQIAQLEGSEFKGHLHKQTERLNAIRAFDYDKVYERRDVLSKGGAQPLHEVDDALKLKDPLVACLRNLQMAFGAGRTSQKSARDEILLCKKTVECLLKDFREIVAADELLADCSPS